MSTRQSISAGEARLLVEATPLPQPAPFFSWDSALPLKCKPVLMCHQLCPLCVQFALTNGKLGRCTIEPFVPLPHFAVRNKKLLMKIYRYICWETPFSALVQKLAFGNVCHILNQLIRIGECCCLPTWFAVLPFGVRRELSSSLNFFPSVFLFTPLFVYGWIVFLSFFSFFLSSQVFYTIHQPYECSNLISSFQITFCVWIACPFRPRLERKYSHGKT